MINNKKVLVVIPARGGSKGIPRKNVRLLNGQPLISYVIQAAQKSRYIDKIVISTDDQEISNVAKMYGVAILKRSAELASDEVPLDPVIFDAVLQLERQGDNYDIVITIQPTSPLLRTKTIDAVIETLVNENLDTVLTAVDDRHLSWTKVDEEFRPKYTERKNRQYLPPEYRETGSVFASKRSAVSETSRFGKKVSLFEVNHLESIDIDSPADWWVAEKLLARKRVVLRVDGYKEIGLGHIYRMLTFANHVMDHEIIFLMDNKHELGINIVRQQNFGIEVFEGDPLLKIKEIEPDIVINDILDTQKEYILSLKDIGIKVFNFEDLGEGAEFADGVFNALYPGSVPTENFYTGEKYYCARPEFLNSKIKQIEKTVRKVLITYGGTDPNNLTVKTLKAIHESKKDFDITIVLGPGYQYSLELEREVKISGREINVYRQVSNMAEHMLEADIIFSSAGRTMYEIAIVGTPAIIIAQNSREMTHLFGHNYNGFVNLGLHSEVDEVKIRETLSRLIEDCDLRQNMNRRMLQHNLKQGLDRVCKIIFGS